MPKPEENNPAQSTEKPRSLQVGKIAAAIALAILLFWSGSYVILNRFFPNLQTTGLFGDPAEAVHALFSALVLAGVVLTVLLQRRELELQRSELAATRREIKGQKEQFTGQKMQFESQTIQFELQNETLIQQRFENTFFHLLTLHHELVASIVDRKTEKGETVVLRGRAVFASTYIPMKARYRGLKPESPENREALNADIELLCKQFSWFHKQFGPYFRNFFSIVEFIDHNKIGYLGVKLFYADLLSAQLSDFEMIFLFYYAVTSPNRERYTALAEKYHLFANLARKDLMDPAHRDYFPAAAFARDAV